MKKNLLKTIRLSDFHPLKTLRCPGGFPTVPCRGFAATLEASESAEAMEVLASRPGRPGSSWRPRQTMGKPWENHGVNGSVQGIFFFRKAPHFRGKSIWFPNVSDRFSQVKHLEDHPTDREGQLWVERVPGCVDSLIYQWAINMLTNH